MKARCLYMGVCVETRVSGTKGLQNDHGELDSGFHKTLEER